MESEHVIADRAYDSNQFRESIIGRRGFRYSTAYSQNT